MDAERFGHQVSRYERPNFRYRCGRAALWGKPCARGPGADGKCGGVSECAPYFNGQGYECRRSPAAGGPCEQGPLPDGRCSIQRPPCVPRRPLRFLRRRATYLALVISLVALIGFAGGRDSLGLIDFDLLDPGPLSGAHARFTEEAGCKGCHDKVGYGPMAWFQGTLTAHDMTESCTACHGFAGPPTSPHNLTLAAEAGGEALQCTACHSEHKGVAYDIAGMNDAQCHACHEQPLKFGSFSSDHPAFGAKYPYEAPTAIKFDHTKHFNVHFEDELYKEQAPKTCQGCHDLERAGQNVPITNFEAMCASCHGDQIAKRPLILVTLPEFETDPVSFVELDEDSEAPPVEEGGVSAEDLLAACGSDHDGLALLEERLELFEEGEEWEDEEDYESVSLEAPSAIDGFLLETDVDDLETYWEPYRALILSLATEGKAALAARIDARLGEGASETILAGLDDELVLAMGCAWAGNVEYEPEDEPLPGPWGSEEGLTLEYSPAGHDDPVMKAWLNRVLALKAEGSEEVEALMAHFLPATDDGPGTCNVCHWLDAGSAENGGEAAKTADSGPIWSHRPSDRHQVRYSHAPTSICWAREPGARAATNWTRAPATSQTSRARGKLAIAVISNRSRSARAVIAIAPKTAFGRTV